MLMKLLIMRERVEVVNDESREAELRRPSLLSSSKVKGR